MINEYLNAIRTRIEQLKRVGNAANLIFWDVQSDEAKSPTLLSFRVYGSTDYVDAVKIACGVSGAWELLPQQRIALLQAADVVALRREYLD